MANETASRFQAALQSTLLWGALCMVATIILAVVAVMIHDFRWILGFAWPFAAVAVWEFTRIIFTRKGMVALVTGVGTIASGSLLLWLYFALVPAETIAEKPQFDTTKDAIKPPSVIPTPAPTPGRKILSTYSRVTYKCKATGVTPDQKTLDKETAASRQYLSVFADTFGYSVSFPTALAIRVKSFQSRQVDKRTWAPQRK